VGAESKHYIDFGQFLQQQRELRGQSLDEVAKSTKIPPTLLEALEAGHSERFPERVFVLNYIRSYAAAVGMSGDDAVNRYQQIPGVPVAEHFDPAELEVVRRTRALTTLWLVLAAVSVGALGLAFDVMTELARKYAYR
jgi:cytoskeletal protein RodZ